MTTDPLLKGVTQIGIGNSWGGQSVTSSEIFGAFYDAVDLLSAAGMHEQWEQNPNTQYANSLYKGDALYIAQQVPLPVALKEHPSILINPVLTTLSIVGPWEGAVWDGNVPKTHEAFKDTHKVYELPENGSISPEAMSGTEIHSFPPQDVPDNKKLLKHQEIRIRSLD